MESSDQSPGTVGIVASPPQGSRPLRRRVCRVCGQHHASHEPHVYDYVEEVDEDVSCHICLQPLVTPVDTPCGHTFCKPCLLAFLKVQQNCPIDRKPLSQQLCSFSSLVLKKLLEKLMVKCPNTEFCSITIQRGDLEDHLKYRCPGNWVSCSFSTAGCTFRGTQKALTTHISTCGFRDQGVNRNPIVEGEISFIEIPRTQTALGIAIVGGADTPLRCVVIQEVFPDGLIAQDGRLQAGDQIIEIESTDMTNSSHHQVCAALRRTPQVLRLGIYRERVDAHRSSFSSPVGREISPSSPTNIPKNPSTVSVSPILNMQPKYGDGEPISYGSSNRESPSRLSPKQENFQDELVHVTLSREAGRQLGIKLGGRRTEPGIFIMELMSGSIAEQDGRLQPNDRILSINGGDVRYSRLDHAFRLIKHSNGHLSLIVSRNAMRGEYDHLFKKPHPDLLVTHTRTKSAPDRLVEQNKDQCAREFNNSFSEAKDFIENDNHDRSASCESLGDPSHRSGRVSRFHSNGSILSQGKYSNGNSLGSFTDLGSTNQNNCSLGSITSGLNKSSRSLTSPFGPTVTEDEETEIVPPVLPPRSRQPLSQNHSFDKLNDSDLSNDITREIPEDTEVKDIAIKSGGTALPASGCAEIVDSHSHANRPKSRRSRDCSDMAEIAIGLRKSLRIEGSQLHQKTVTISKDPSESLGMRIGGGVSSNEGNIPIYIANIHPQGPVGKSKQVKKGDILLSVNGHSLLGLTHTQSVSLLKATAELAGVTLSLLEGSETHAGPANFVPSWLYWQRLPRALHISKSVVLHRPLGASLGFSIVGGSDPQRGPEPIHVLFVVSTSPAAIDGRLRCGDRLLSVDGHCLEGVSHATAVSLLKQAGQRVTLEVVSWMGTEL